jgi:ABC-2 type transport system permease protein
MVQLALPTGRHAGLVANFASRELKSRFKGSVLGWTWSLINPLATLAVYSLVFGFFLKFPPPVAGNGHLKNFSIYLFTALVQWNLFFAVVTGSMGALVGAGPLLRKIYFPPWTPIAGSAIAALTQTGIELGLLIVVYVAVGNISWTVVFVPVLLALLVAFSLGLGYVLALFNAKLRDVNYLVQVGLNLLFYACPIIYPISKVQDVAKHHAWVHIYYWNPLTQFVEANRDVLYDLRAPSLARMAYLTVVSLTVLVAGWLYFEHGSRDVSEEL